MSEDIDFNEDIDEEDYTMAGRHAQIVENGNKTARIVGIIIIVSVLSVSCSCIYALNYLVGGMP